MGHPNSSITFGIPLASSDGRYYSRYPSGDRFGVAGNASGGLIAVSAAPPAATAFQSSFTPLRRINFDGLSNGQRIVAKDAGSIDGKRFDDSLGTVGFAGGFGMQATTAIHASGKTSCAALSIRQGSDGDPTDIGAGMGPFGGMINLGSDRVLEGEELWWGMRVMFPTGFNFLTPNPILKFLRISQVNKFTLNRDNPDTTGKLEHFIANGVAFDSGTPNVTGWGLQSEVFGDLTQPSFVKPSDRNVGNPLNSFHWVCGYAKVSATASLCNRRIWCDDQLAFERTAGQFNKWHTGTGYHTDTANTPERILLNSSQALDTFYVFTYWNGLSPQDQTCYIQDFVYVKNPADVPSVDEFGNRMIASGDVL